MVDRGVANILGNASDLVVTRKGRHLKTAKQKTDGRPKCCQYS